MMEGDHGFNCMVAKLIVLVGTVIVLIWVMYKDKGYGP